MDSISLWLPVLINVGFYIYGYGKITQAVKDLDARVQRIEKHFDKKIEEA